MQQTKRLPHVQVMSQKYKANKTILLQATHTSEEAYNVLVYNTAIAWVRANIWNDDDLVDAITSYKQFWAWWLNHWYMREDAFIHNYLEYVIANADFSDYLRAEWLKIHDVKGLHIIISHQPQWLEDAYSNLISETFKKIKP